MVVMERSVDKGENSEHSVSGVLARTFTVLVQPLPRGFIVLVRVVLHFDCSGKAAAGPVYR